MVESVEGEEKYLEGDAMFDGKPMKSENLFQPRCRTEI